MHPGAHVDIRATPCLDGEIADVVVITERSHTGDIVTSRGTWLMDQRPDYMCVV